jgi:hypothetical protein
MHFIKQTQIIYSAEFMYVVDYMYFNINMRLQNIFH